MTKDIPDHQPHATVANWIASRQAHCALTDEALAAQLGYDQPAVVRMMKSGAMRVPISKIPSLARALKVEPGDAMQLVLKETCPDILAAIEECVGPLRLTDKEQGLIKALRRASGGADIAPIFFEGAPVIAVVVGYGPHGTVPKRLGATPAL